MTTARLPNTSIRARIWRLVMLACCTLGALMGVLGWTLERARESNARFTHALEVRTALGAYTRELIDAETGQRNYLLTHQNIDLAPYQQVMSDNKARLARLAELIANDPAQIKLQQLEAIFNDKLAELGATIQLAKTGQHDAALAILVAGSGRRDTEAFLRLRTEIIDLETTALTAHQVAAENKDRTILLVAGIGGILALLLIIGAARRTIAGIDRPLGDLMQAIAALDRRELDQRPNLRSRDEIGKVARAFDDMAGRLTASNRAAEQADKIKTQLAALVASSTDAIMSKTVDGIVTSWNPAAEKMFGYTAEEMIGKPMALLIPKDRADEETLILGQIRAGTNVEHFETVRLRKDGKLFPVSVTISPIKDAAGNIVGASKIARDISDRRLAERRLEESEERYRALAESLPQLIWTCAADGRCDYLSPQWVTYTGRSEAEQLGYGWTNQIHPEDRDRVNQAWTEATERGGQFDIDFRLRQSDGAYRWFRTRAVPLRGDNGAVVKWFGSCSDSQDYKSAEQRTMAQFERVNLLYQITRAIGGRQDLASIFQVTILTVEEQLPADFCCLCLRDEMDMALRVTAIGIKSAVVGAVRAGPDGEKIDIEVNGLDRCLRGELIYEPDLAGFDLPLPRRLAEAGLGSVVFAPVQIESRMFGLMVIARKAVNGFSSGDCEFLRQLNEHVALATHQAQLYDALQKAYDDLRQSQQSALQQERLRALGQMASGIAHDINNALTPASLYTESMLENKTLDARERSTLEIVHRAIQDVGHTVGRMREFYREPNGQLKQSPLLLNDLIHQVADLTRARWSDIAIQRGAMIDVTFDLAADLPPVVGVESEIREALINLVLNAVDAMPQGGRIEFRTAVVSNGNGPRVRIEVIDDGIGMDEETRRRCLEPFFTTKGELGTGLGLGMVYGVTQRHGAALEIESATGQGTTVRLLFPVADLSKSAEPAMTPLPRPARLRLLVVDDEAMLLNTLRRILETDGHEVDTANGGQAGIETFRESLRGGRGYDAVITDLGMPHVDGSKVAAAIKADSPATPVIMLTGWGKRLIAENDMPANVDKVIGKPPRLADLRLAVAELCRGEAR